MNLDRRRNSRHAVHRAVYVDLVPSNGAWLSNISEGGLGLDLFVPAVSGQAVRLGFYLPGTGNHIEANCQITWTDRLGQKAGLRFLDLPEASHERIKEWLFAPAPILWMRRLIRLFVGAIVLSGLTLAFFYMSGRGQSSSGSRTVPNANRQTVSPSDIPGPWVKPPDASGTDSTSSAPLIPRGAVLLQVAALTQENNALAMAEALRKKNFPAFVLKPSADRYYRVRVGPYADTESAHLAKRMLQKRGFQAIVKR
jgi:hypothetical protein